MKFVADVRAVSQHDCYHNWDFVLAQGGFFTILVPCTKDRRRGPRTEHANPVLIFAHDTGLVEVHLRIEKLRDQGADINSLIAILRSVDLSEDYADDMAPCKQAEIAATRIANAVMDCLR